jgi:hypothetical protein
MRQPDQPNSMSGFDLLLTALAVTLALLCIPMVIEFSGGTSGRVLLLSCMVLPPVLGLGFVHVRDGFPPSAPAPLARRSGRERIEGTHRRA